MHLLPTRAKRNLLSTPSECTGQADRQRYDAAKATSADSLELDVDVPERVRDSTSRALELSEGGCDPYRAETGRGGSHTQHGCEQTKVGMCGPRVCIGARWLRLLRCRRESKRKHLAPGGQ